MGGRRVEGRGNGAGRQGGREAGKHTPPPPSPPYGTREEEKKDNGNLLEQQPQHPMKTSSPPDQKIDRSHTTTTTAGRKPPKPLPDLWIVHHRPQTADAGTHRRSLPSFLPQKGGTKLMQDASLTSLGTGPVPVRQQHLISPEACVLREGCRQPLASDPIEGGFHQISHGRT